MFDPCFSVQCLVTKEKRAGCLIKIGYLCPVAVSVLYPFRVESKISGFI